MNYNNEKENEFLNEIQEKIKKRSGGLYYNKSLKSIKKRLSITSFILIFVIFLWALINFIYQRISFNSEVINKAPKLLKKHKNKIIASKFKKKISKQKFKYIFTSSKKITFDDSKILKKILKKYQKIRNKNFYVYIIPEVDIKSILILMLKMNLNIKKERYIDGSNYYEILLSKELLDIVDKK